MSGGDFLDGMVSEVPRGVRGDCPDSMVPEVPLV